MVTVLMLRSLVLDSVMDNNAVLTFEPCNVSQCVDVIVNDDMIPEPTETFGIILEWTDLHRITVEPPEATIEIIDKNGIHCLPSLAGQHFTTSLSIHQRLLLV